MWLYIYYDDGCELVVLKNVRMVVVGVYSMLVYPNGVSYLLDILHYGSCTVQMKVKIRRAKQIFREIPLDTYVPDMIAILAGTTAVN